MVIRRSIFLVLACGVALAASFTWFFIHSNRPQTLEEEVYSAVIDLGIQGIRSRDDHVLVEFRGGSTVSDPAVRKRIFRSVSWGRLTIIDIYPKTLNGSFLDPLTGKHADEFSISIEKWLAPTEVIVSVSFISAPLVGGGGKFVMAKSGNSWVLKESLERWRT